VACDGSTVSVTNIEVDRTLSASYGGYEILIDGVSSGTYSDPLLAYPASHFNNCVSSIDNASYSDTVATAVYATGGTINLDTVSIARASAEGIFYSAAAVNLYGTIDPITATIENLTVTEQGYGPALSMEGSTADGGFTANLVASDIVINGGEDHSIDLEYTNSQFDEPSLSGMVGSGLYVTGGIVSVQGGVISDSGSEGVYATGADLTLTELFIQNSDSHGVRVESGTLSATDNSIQENTGNGVTLTNTESSTLSDNIITNNGSYGLHCGDSSFLVCENEFSGNTLGPTDDCGVVCGFEDAGSDADTDGGEDPDADADFDGGGDMDDTGMPPPP
jgi:hypothetical protein